MKKRQWKGMALLLLLLTTAIMQSIFCIRTQAKDDTAEKEMDGISVKLSVDKVRYREEDPVKVTLEIFNDGASKIRYADISWKMTRGMEMLPQAEAAGLIREIMPGDSKSITVSYTGDPEEYGYAVSGWFIFTMVALNTVMILTAMLIIGSIKKNEKKHTGWKKKHICRGVMILAAAAAVCGLSFAQPVLAAKQPIYHGLTADSVETKTAVVTISFEYAGETVKVQAELELQVEK